ncbi:MAG: nucleotidyltransferase domain-containing protein [Rhodopila sp.]
MAEQQRVGAWFRSRHDSLIPQDRCSGSGDPAPPRKQTEDASSDDPILDRFRQALTDAYGSKLERVVLFGSHARGEERPDSDYDIAVFIHDPQSNPLGWPQ